MMQVIAEITWSCPGKCVFCPVPKSSVIMDIKSYRKALNLFSRLSEERAVVLSGGEPTVLPRLYEYVRAAKKLGYAVTLATNAFFPERALSSGADLIEVSLDYWGERHDETRGVEGLFDRARKLIEEGGERVVVRATLMRDNVGDILKIRREFGVPVFVMPVRGCPELAPTREQIEELEKHDGIYVADSCPAGISSFVIAPTEDRRVLQVLACIFYRHRLGFLKKYDERELREVLERGRTIPRFPCEARSGEPIHDPLPT